MSRFGPDFLTKEEGLSRAKILGFERVELIKGYIRLACPQERDDAAAS